MITFDTSGLLSFINSSDPDHKSVKATLAEVRAPFILPVALLSEACYMIDARLGAVALKSFLSSLRSGDFECDCGEGDFRRISELVARYQSLKLGFADACVIACAERNGGYVLTLDTRDMAVVAREKKIKVLP